MRFGVRLSPKKLLYEVKPIKIVLRSSRLVNEFNPKWNRSNLVPKSNEHKIQTDRHKEGNKGFQ